VIDIGNPIPFFETKDQDGKTVKSTDLIGDKNLVLYFYPRNFTRGCTAQSCTFRDSIARFASLDARIVGVSGDSPEGHRKFISAHGLNFSLLADEDGSVRKAFGLKGILFGLIPSRSTFVIDKSGVIRFSTTHLGQSEAHVAEAKAALEAMRVAGEDFIRNPDAKNTLA